VKGPAEATAEQWEAGGLIAMAVGTGKPVLDVGLKQRQQQQAISPWMVGEAKGCPELGSLPLLRRCGYQKTVTTVYREMARRGRREIVVDTRLVRGR
jgi:hypothetical protein